MLNGKRFLRGFTMIELIVALAIVGVILTLAAPKYFGNVDKSKEAVLREDLYVMRDALDKFFADKQKYPDVLDDLVTEKYLKSIPIDPFTLSAKSWITVPPEEASLGGVYNIKSSAPNKARDGTWYKDW